MTKTYTLSAYGTFTNRKHRRVQLAIPLPTDGPFTLRDISVCIPGPGQETKFEATIENNRGELLGPMIAPAVIVPLIPAVPYGPGHILKLYAQLDATTNIGPRETAVFGYFVRNH